MTSQLSKLHSVEVEILDYVVDICNEYDLKYCLVYGTALGAYRHQGFIPWDDDIDIAMPYEDYCRLKSIISKNDSKYEFQDMYNENNYFMTFGKVRKRNTIFKESIIEKPLDKCGIYIDIFPLYYINSKGIKICVINYLKHIVKFSTHRKLYKGKYTIAKYAVSSVISAPATIFGAKRILYMLDKYIKKNDSKTGKYLAEFDETGMIQAIESSIYFPTIKLKFEDKMYEVPGKINDYLTIAYGEDYMTLPPVEERHTHMPSVLKFGDE